MPASETVKVNTNLSYRVADIIDKKCALCDLVALLPGQCSFVHQYLVVSCRRN